MPYKMSDVLRDLAFLAQQADADGRTDLQPVYVGFALPGSSASAGSAVWCIKKITYNADGSLAYVQWASGNALMNKDWSKRKDATYTYS